MNKKVSKIIMVMLVVVLAFPGLKSEAHLNTKAVNGAPTVSSLVRGTISTSYISKYGNVYLSITSEDFFAAGYNYGDVVKVKFLGKKFRLPFVSNYSDVDTGKPAVIAREGESNIMLAINMGDFATTYGLATKSVKEDGSFEWNYPEGVTGPVKVSIWLKKAGGYADQYELHRLSYTNERSDYLGLSDEEFANFRAVSTTGMGFGTLYRTSSPIDPSNNRNMFADQAIRDTGVSVIVNLTDTMDEAESYDGFSDTYYSTTKYIALSMDVDFTSEDFQEKLAEGLRFMAENPGVYAIHCKEGKDRAGFVTAILECLMGASYDEVIDDYMLSFYNYYGVTKGDPKYETIVKSNIATTLKNAFTFKKKDKKKDLGTRDLSACATKYLKKIGLTKQEIKKLKKNLSKSLAFVEKNVPVVCEDGTVRAFKMRFYPGEPNIPYCGIKEFTDFMGYNILSSEKDESGNLVFTSPQGIKAVADIKAKTLSTDNWAAFHYPEAPYEGDPKSYRDSNCGFIRITEVEFEGTSKPVVFDFNKYGFEMHSDDTDVYLPMSLVGNLMSDIATWHMVWNGEKGYYGRLMSNSYSSEFISNSKVLNEVVDEMVRPKDLAIETYRELCFCFDHFYGHPGVAALDKELKEKGLNQALLGMGPEGESLVERLKSTDTKEYYSALMELFFTYFDDKGHTAPSDMLEFYVFRIFPNMSSSEQIEFYSSLMDYLPTKNSLLYGDIVTTRDAIWGDDVYREYGNTAIIRLVDFMPDEEGWISFYNGEGDIPMDSAGITITGLKRASENPNIKNILFDLSANNGGSSDVLSFITILTVGRDKLYGLDKINDQKFTITFEADTNLDGVFDEKDKELVYDRFNYGVLTSKQSFSCGNLFPIIMQEEGAVLLGEPTGGGSCCVQIGVQPDGTSFAMSSAQWALIDSNGNSVESGCNTDLVIEHEETVGSYYGTEMVQYDYSSYFDDKKLDNMLNGWFADKEGKEAA